MDGNLRSSIIECLKSMEVKKRVPYNIQTENSERVQSAQTDNSQRTTLNSPELHSELAMANSNTLSNMTDSDPPTQSTEMNSQLIADSPEICPACEEYADNDVCCDRCQCWLHFGCEALSDSDIDKYDDINIPYICTICGYDDQCQMLDDSILFTQFRVNEIDEETHPEK